MKNNITAVEIAKICGVSQGTVDRALNNRAGISEKTKKAILAVAEKYGYRPNIHASSMAGGKSKLIGIIVFDLNNSYFSDILTEIEDCCTQRGYSTIVMFSHKDSDRELECVKSMARLSVDGIALCPISKGAEYEDFLHSFDIPIVTIGNRLDSFEYVGIDNHLAMTDALNYVNQNNYKSFLYVKPKLQEKNIYAQEERLRAFEEFCKKRGIEHVITTINEAIDIKKDMAVICSSDAYALKLMKKADEIGAGILGFDNTKLIEEAKIELDSVAYDTFDVAKKVCDYLINKVTPNGFVKHSIKKRGSI